MLYMVPCCENKIKDELVKAPCTNVILLLPDGQISKPEIQVEKVPD